MGLSNRSATLFVRSGGLKFKGNSTTETGYGYINFYGQDVPSGVYATYSVLTDKGLYTIFTGRSPVTLPSGILLYIASGKLTLRIPGNLTEANSELFIAAKVEIGTYQTLAHNEGTEDNPNWVLNEIPDWNEVRYKCNPTIGSNLATVEYSSTVSKQDGYQQGDYLVYNGQLYKVTATSISQGQTLTPGGNIISTTVSDNMYDIGSPGVVDIPQFIAAGYITGSGNYVNFGLPLKVKNGLNISASILTASTLFTPPSARHNDVISSLRVADRNNFLLTLEGTLSSTMTANQVCTVTIIGLRITATSA